MKRLQTAFLSGLLLLTFSSYLLHAQRPTPTPVGIEEAPIDARLILPNNKVTLTIRSSGIEGSSLPSGLPLEQGDVIRTGPHSSTEISFSAGTLVHLKEGGVLRLKLLTPAKIVLNLRAGTLLAKVKFDKKEGKQFWVETLNARAAVRGTEFVVEQDGSRTQIGVLDEGHVEVTSPGFKKAVLLHFNQETYVLHNSPPNRASVLEHFFPSKSLMAQMRQRLRPIRKRWNPLTPEQRQRTRNAWIKHHAHPLPQ